MDETERSKNLIVRHAEAEAKKDVINLSDRAGSGVAAFFVFLAVLFFVIHQTMPTGFFTSEFRSTEVIFFYLPQLLTMAHSLARAVLGRKNMLRLPETFMNGFAVVSAVWLYSVFPFDFSHLPDPLPGFLRFAAAWISDGIARFFMLIAIIAFSAMTIYTAVLYAYVRRALKS